MADYQNNVLEGNEGNNTQARLIDIGISYSCDGSSFSNPNILDTPDGTTTVNSQVCGSGSNYYKIHFWHDVEILIGNLNRNVDIGIYDPENESQLFTSSNSGTSQETLNLRCNMCGSTIIIRIVGIDAGGSSYRMLITD
jgi:hypothetical protein